MFKSLNLAKLFKPAVVSVVSLSLYSYYIKEQQAPVSLTTINQHSLKTKPYYSDLSQD